MRSEATTLPRILAAVMDRLVSNGDVPLQGLGASENKNLSRRRMIISHSRTGTAAAYTRAVLVHSLTRRTTI